MNFNTLSRKILTCCVILQVILTLIAVPSVGNGADLDLKKLFHESIPVSPFIGVVYAYADAMLKHGRDTYGPVKTGLLLSSLDRKTLKPLNSRPPAPSGVSSKIRPGELGKPLVGTNLQLDQNLLRLLYFLKGLSGEERYPKTADASLKWLLVNGQSRNTGLLPWGEYLCWDVLNDQVISSGVGEPLHKFSRPWMLWEKCFQLAPTESKRFALGLLKNHVVDLNSGKITNRAQFARKSSQESSGSPRHMGFFIRTWAEAFAYTDDETFLKPIDAVLTSQEKILRSSLRQNRPRSNSLNYCDRISMAIDCDGASRKVPQPLRNRLRAFAAREDAEFLSLPHDLKGRKAFIKSFDSTEPEPLYAYTSQWDPKNGKQSTASVGVMCMSRYENTGKVGYRDLITAAADSYLESLPGDNIDAWPVSFGNAITLELAAFRITAKQKYHTRAFKLGEIALEKFFDESPLPRASLKSRHYESTTGADTLVLALAELHLSTLTITAVRTPSNTIDR